MAFGMSAKATTPSNIATYFRNNCPRCCTGRDRTASWSFNWAVELLGSIRNPALRFQSLPVVQILPDSANRYLSRRRSTAPELDRNSRGGAVLIGPPCGAARTATQLCRAPTSVWRSAIRKSRYLCMMSNRGLPCPKYLLAIRL